MEMKRYRLGEICTLNAQSLKSSDGLKEILYLDTGNITENLIDNFQTFTVSNAPSRAQRKVKDKTIIFSTVRPNQKHFGILRNPPNNLIVSSGFTTLDVKDDKKFDAQYVYLKLSQHNVVDYLQTLAQNSVSAYPSVNPDDIGNLSLAFPDFVTQQKIAAVLSSLDDKIALNRRMNEKLETMAKRLYDRWFVQFDFPDADGRPYKTSGGKMAWNAALKREIPAGWENGVLSDIANITMGQSLDGKSYNQNNNGSVFYQGSTDFGIRFPSVRQYTTEPKRFAKKGDILVSVRAPVGAMNIASTDCCIGRGLSAMNSKLGSITHLYYVIDYFRHKFENKNTVGTTFGSITKDELFRLPIVLPNKIVLKNFEEIVKPFFDRQMNINYEIEKLTALRDRLLPLLMNGQVAVG